MVDDPVVRRARLQLMANLRDLVLQLADISEIARLRRSRPEACETNNELRTTDDKLRTARSRAHAHGQETRAQEIVGEATAAPKARSPKPKASAASAKATAGKGKYVYCFGRKTDGNGTMKPLLGGKGANLAEMCRIGLPVPPGFTITTEVCTYYYANKRTYPPALRGPDGSRRRRARAADRQDVRRPEGPAAGLGALRRPRLDAGHDGHDPQSRPERPDRRGARRPRPGIRASPGTATAASSRCTATSCSACRSAPTRITIRSRP